MNTLGAFVWPALMIAALVVTGVVLAPRAGAGRSRMWAGLAVLIAAQALSAIWQLLWVQIVAAASGADRIASLSLMQIGFTIVYGIIHLLGIVLLATATTIGRQQIVGYPDPSRPGAPPSAAAGSPYVTGPDQPQPPR